MEEIKYFLQQVSEDHLKQHLFYLAQNPLPCRTLNFTLPGHTECTLCEADAYLSWHLSQAGYAVTREVVPVQAFQYDATTPHHFRKPYPAEPWYQAVNLYAKQRGLEPGREAIILLAHKDSQSWLPGAPGAHDNAVGTVAVLEIARVSRHYPPRRGLWFLFTNEEHWPWTSEFAAQAIARAGWDLLAVFNLDSLSGKPAAIQSAGRKCNVTRYTTAEGEYLANLLAALNTLFNLKLEQQGFRCDVPNDDDGAFVKAGFPAAVLNIGSFPYAEPFYHTENDRPENVDLENLKLTTQLTLAAVLLLDRFGKKLSVENLAACAAQFRQE
ncbi:M28 family metallopeptidase [candidate division KSB1 bacterium]|nr:M28 family metallopeptidase [candidate division KSB1 bacterium]